MNDHLYLSDLSEGPIVPQLQHHISLFYMDLLTAQIHQYLLFRSISPTSMKGMLSVNKIPREPEDECQNPLRK